MNTVTLSVEEIQKRLKLHQLWLDNKDKGCQFYLYPHEDLNGADLRNANLAYANFKKANLINTDFTKANLNNTNFMYANLREANLCKANAHGANLYKATLTYANLYDTNLHAANLYGADLTYANLILANLHTANLEGADLTEANIDYSIWPMWCGSLGVKIDKRIAAQLAYHFCSIICDDAEYLAAREALLSLANQFHCIGSDCDTLYTKDTQTKVLDTK